MTAALLGFQCAFQCAVAPGHLPLVSSPLSQASGAQLCVLKCGSTCGRHRQCYLSFACKMHSWSWVGSILQSTAPWVTLLFLHISALMWPMQWHSVQIFIKVSFIFFYSLWINTSSCGISLHTFMGPSYCTTLSSPSWKISSGDSISSTPKDSEPRV